MAKKPTGKNEKKGLRILKIVAFILALVIVLGVFIAYKVADSGIIQRNVVAAESENYKVTTPMLTYYFNAMYQSYAGQSNGSLLQYMGLDSTKSLKEQNYTNDQTWYDYFMDMTKAQVQQILVLAEAARAQGLKLTDAQKEEIDAMISDFDTYAKQYGYSSTDHFVQRAYGPGVRAKDIRACMELSYLADAYTEYLVDTYDYTEADWNAYFEENEKNYLKIDFLSYTFKAEEKKDTDKDKKDDDKKDEDADSTAEDAAVLKGYADELAATKDAEAFKDYIAKYVLNVRYKGDAAAMTKDKVDPAEVAENCLTEGRTASTESDFNTWAFDEERNPYDVFTDYDDEKETYTVYMLLPAKDYSDLESACVYRDAYALKNYRFMQVHLDDVGDDAKAAADIAAKFVDSLKEKGNTEEAFEELAGDTNTSLHFGNAQNADKGALADCVDEWVFDASRKEGDITTVHDSDAYYVLYYLGDGAVKWQYNVDNALKNAKYSEDLDALIADTTVTFQTKGLAMVQEVSKG